MLKLMTSSILLIFSLYAVAQITAPAAGETGPFHIGGVIRGQKADKIYLLAIIGGKSSLLDSTGFEKDDSFHFEFPEAPSPGFYQLVLPQQEPVDLIIGTEPVFFETRAGHLRDSIRVVTSLETRLFYTLVRHERPINAKLSALNQVVKLYARDTDKLEFKKMISAEIRALQHKFNRLQNEIKEKHSHTFLAKLIQMNQQPSLDAHPEYQWKYSDNTAFLREHYFDYVDFSDERILRSNILPTKYSGYLNLVPEQTAEAYLNAVQYILTVSAENQAIYEWTVGYLLESFQKSDYDEVFFYLSDVFGSVEGCRNEELSFNLEKAKETRKRLAPGNVAPDISLPGIDGTERKLSAVTGQYTLLFFWATWCPHCTDALPDLVSLYRKYRDAGFEVYAVSIDNEKPPWVETVQNHGADWTNVGQLKGWDSDVVDTYNVRATPTYYLLDKDKKIVRRFLRLSQLQEELETMF